MHAARRQSSLAIPAAANQSRGIGGGNLLRLQLAQPDRSQRRGEILAGDLGVALIGFRRDLRLDLREPLFEELPEREKLRGLRRAAAGLQFGDQPGTLDLRRRLVPAKLCQRRLRLPVCGSRSSRIMAQRPGLRSFRWPFIGLTPSAGPT